MFRSLFAVVLLFTFSAKMITSLPKPSPSPTPTAGDNFVFPKSDDSVTVDPEKRIAKPTAKKSDIVKCLDLGDQMPAFNPTTFKFECHPLATRGPCSGESGSTKKCL